jgi:hypothetical protein
MKQFIYQIRHCPTRFRVQFILRAVVRQIHRQLWLLWTRLPSRARVWHRYCDWVGYDAWSRKWTDTYPRKFWENSDEAQ